MRYYIIIIGLLLCSLQAFPQNRFGVAVHCDGQAGFASRANSGFSFGVSGLGVLHANIVDISIGVGYSYKTCSHEESRITYMGNIQEERFKIIHQMHYLNIPFILDIQCWRQEKWRLILHNKLEYSRLCGYSAFAQENWHPITIDKWDDIPREARNGLSYQLGLTLSYAVTEHCILNTTPFFGVKAIRNEYLPTPTHFPSAQHGYLPDHLFHSGITIGFEYRF